MIWTEALPDPVHKTVTMTCVAPACTLNVSVLGPVVVEEAEVVDVVDVVEDVEEVEDVVIDGVVVVEEAALKVAITPAQWLLLEVVTPDPAVPVVDTISSRTEAVVDDPESKPSINVKPFVGDLVAPAPPLYVAIAPSQSSFATVVVEVVPVTTEVPDVADDDAV